MARIGLDNPAFNGRVRDYRRSPSHSRRHIVPTRRPASPLKQPTMPIKAAKPQHLPQAAMPSPPAMPGPQVPLTAPSNIPKKSRTQLALIAMAAILFIFGSTVAFLGLKTNTSVKVQAQSQAKASSSSGGLANLDETKPSTSSINSYRVAPDLPRFITIPKLAAKARVRQLSVDANNQLQAPNNIFDTGWYTGSSKPGDVGGTMLIDGHVSGPTQHGTFYDLKTLQPGDKISVENGAGKIFNYSVVKSQSYDADKTDMAAALQSAEVGKAGLNLMTCTGKFDAKSNQFQQRIVVFAVAN